VVIFCLFLFPIIPYIGERG